MKKILLEKFVWLRAGLVLAGVVLLGSVTAYFYFEIKEFVDIMKATVYPGSRKFEGGDITAARLFGDYLFFTLKETTIPPDWYNICEASGYILFFPAVIVAAIFVHFKKIRIPALVWLLSGYLVILSVWALTGLPAIIAKVLLLDQISGVRTSSFIGISSIILVVVFLNESKRFSSAFKASSVTVFLLGIFIGIYWIMGKINFMFTDKISPEELLGLAGYFTLMHLCFFTKWKWGRIAFFIALIPFLIPNLLINPVSRGLDPITKHPIYTFMSGVKQRFSDGRWIVFGPNSPVVANLLKASGMRVFGGATLSPNIREMEILDEQKKYNEVYNRYIDQFNIIPAPKGTQPQFTLNFGDAITLAIPPCDYKLKDIDIRYALFLYGPQAEETECMQILDSKFPFPAFSYKDSVAGSTMSRATTN
ncbi:MAG: hypothetical protein EPN85_09430 [Bacteroidetes bacterium]|nr:MAG: hypothetical protein EPN85_09430 [Bacteroidota bacterium]